MAKLSVIITAYDQHELTQAHVRACMEVTRVPDEIIVINDHGKKNLLKMLKDIKDRKCPIIYSYIKDDIEWNYNGACNLGVWLSSGDYLAFEDNDNFPSLTFYEEVLQYAKDNPKLGRIQATKRKTVKDIMLPREEWEIIGREGPNMGTAVFPRKVFLDLKGHDERLCGRYGWMYYDLRSRGMGKMTREYYSGSVGEYFYTKQGQSNLKRGMSGENRGYYIENAKRVESGKGYQHPDGILNFSYETTYIRDTK